jgi:hypothetical protein
MNDAVNLNLLQSLQSVRLLLIQPHHCLQPPLLAGKTCFACPTVDKLGKLLSTDNALRAAVAKVCPVHPIGNLIIPSRISVSRYSDLRAAKLIIVAIGIRLCVSSPFFSYQWWPLTNKFLPCVLAGHAPVTDISFTAMEIEEVTGLWLAMSISNGGTNMGAGPNIKI